MLNKRAFRRWATNALLAVILSSAAASAEAQAVDTVMSLGEALGLLRQYSPEYRVSLAQADFAGENVWRAWGSWLPSVTTRASFAANESTRRTAVDDFGVSQEIDDAIDISSKSSFQSLEFAWQLFDGGTRLFDVGASRAEGRAANLAAVATLVNLESRVESQYYETLKQQELARVSRELLAARRRDLDVAEARFRIAAVAQTDVLQADIEAARQELAVLQADQATNAARRELSAIVGIEEDLAYQLRDASQVFDPSPIDVESLVGIGTRSHPSLARRDADIDARRRGLWAARGNWLPDVSLSLTLSRSENLGPDGDFFTLNPRDTGTDFRLMFSWPLLNGFEKKWQTGQEAARLSEARHRRRAEAIEIEKDIRNLYEELDTRHRAFQIQERAVRQARELVRLATERYRIGAASYVELQQATTSATDSERGLIEARYEFMKSLAQLKAAVGRPFSVNQ